MADLKRGWNGWIAFALERPKLFRLVIESTRSDPNASQEAFVIMRAIVERLAIEGRLTTDADTAARAIWAASHEVVTLLMQGTPVAEVKASSELLLMRLWPSSFDQSNWPVRCGSHQRRMRDPISAPRPVIKTMPIVYQAARNSGLSSGQWLA